MTQEETKQTKQQMEATDTGTPAVQPLNPHTDYTQSLSTCHKMGWMGSSLTAWCVSKMIYSTAGCCWSAASQFSRFMLCIMSAALENKCSAVTCSAAHHSLEPLHCDKRLPASISTFPLPLLSEAEET